MLNTDNQVLRVVTDLVAFIRQRGYEPGERLPSERDLTNRFAVGRGVVREALTVLEASRYLVRRPNSGVYLSSMSDQVSLETLVLYSKLEIPMDRRTIVECMEVRKILELQAIRLAAERRTVSDLVALNHILSQSQAAIEEGRSISDLDFDFHIAIFRASQNDIFVRVVTPFYLMARQRRDDFFSNPQHCLASHRHHVAMVHAIETQAGPEAVALMESHIGRVESHYLAGQPEGEKGK